MSEEKLLLTPEEAAYKVNLSRTKMFALISSKEIPSLKIGKKRLVSRNELESWVVRQTRESK